MRAGPTALLAGTAMVGAGLVAFLLGQSGEGSAEAVRHGGTFVGLLGIGVLTAGVLLHLIGERWQYE